MKIVTRTMGAALGLLFGLSAVTAEAQLSKPNQKCRDSIAKSFAKAVGSGAKVSAGCHKSRNAGKTLPAIDCNDLATSQADAKLKFQKAQAKLEAAVVKACTAAGVDTTVLDNFISCPEPCGTSTGVSNPLASYTDLGECLACLAGDIIERRNTVMLGLPAAGMTKDEQSCHASIPKGYDKHLKTLLKDRQGCQKDEDATGNNTLQPCDTSDPKGKIAAAVTAAAAGVADACAGQNLADIDSCSAVDIASLNACLLAEENARGSEGFTASYETDATVCPIRVDSTVLAGTGLSGTTRSFIEIGWKASVHDADLADQYVLSSDVTCAASPPCGDCTIDGISSAGPMYASFSRCRNNFSIRCDELFGPDLDDCGGADCVYVLGPPLPISAGNNPTCNINTLSTDVAGLLNPDTGTATLTVNLRTFVYLGVEIVQPCAICVGDPTPQDGVQGGLCQGGLDSGTDCDVEGWDATFAPQADDVGLSLDCRPPATNVSGTGLLIPLEFTTGHTELAFENSCDAPLNILDCACGVCTGDTGLPCRNDAECAAALVGTCTSKGGGVNRAPNDCSDLVCSPVGDDKGECSAPGNNLNFCSGVLRANGNGFVACNDNADCANTECDPSTPLADGCGDCTVTQIKPCFLDPIVDDGDPDPDNPLLVTTFCIPPTSAAAINSTGGLPGPARVATDMVVEKAF